MVAVLLEQTLVQATRRSGDAHLAGAENVLAISVRRLVGAQVGKVEEDVARATHAHVRGALEQARLAALRRLLLFGCSTVGALLAQRFFDEAKVALLPEQIDLLALNRFLFEIYNYNVQITKQVGEKEGARREAYPATRVARALDKREARLGITRGFVSPA